MLKQLTAAIIMASTLSIMGCETLPGNSAAQTTQNLQLLQNRTWIVTQIGNTEIKTAPTAHNIPSLQFDAATQRVSGADGCNRIMGSYTASKDTLSLGQMAGTRMACTNNDNLDQKFNEALSKVTHYQVFGKTLKLLDRHGNLLIQLETAAQPR
ncbi:META domain-containing protein [Acinetobacter bohemicus]|uniref:META domain-containing protein n=1 Tax=Acinetobacter TaxID=469 RepID=UPI001194C054|nr:MULTISPECIES: META domain-containing protein [Acinetobacter]MCO8041451.1 META domain-containing protein [Acinetobacter sp. S4400-12]MCU7223858.1 META domain-containing protein [Acinetobacter bohemicus]TSH75982.1 META domain-containing protein [Acinetobacter sp. RF15A]TSI18078.1 META domain-containing protein [Acinetobacter sp. RF15B]